MEIEFDPRKDAINIKKHGISLTEARHFEWESAFIWPDTRFDYNEERMAGIGYIGLALYRVAYVDRAHALRVISLRRATRREENHYANA